MQVIPPVENLWTHFCLGFLAGVPAVLIALAVLINALRNGAAAKNAHEGLQKALDDLLAKFTPSQGGTGQPDAITGQPPASDPETAITNKPQE